MSLRGLRQHGRCTNRGGVPLVARVSLRGSVQKDRGGVPLAARVSTSDSPSQSNTSLEQSLIALECKKRRAFTCKHVTPSLQHSAALRAAGSSLLTRAQWRCCRIACKARMQFGIVNWIPGTGMKKTSASGRGLCSGGAGNRTRVLR